MRVCIVSFKKCWQDQDGRWYSTGGFPLQMSAVASLFDEVSMLVVKTEPLKGGIPLPEQAEVVPLRPPLGQDIRRKFDVMLHLPCYVKKIALHAAQADVVHVPLPGDVPLLAVFVALVLRKHIIARYGGSWFTNSETTLMSRFTKYIMKRFAGNRNVMFATGDNTAPLSSGMHWLYVTSLSKEDVHAVKPDINRSLHMSPRLVYIGRLSQEKSVDSLIKALGVLKREKFEPLPQVDIIGDGPLRASLEVLAAEEGCSGSVRFTGQLDRKELSRKLRGMDICVQPSLTEGFSKAWLDAMLHGLPVISSDVGAAAGVIGKEEERGWLVPPGDVTALVQKIRSVLNGKIEWPVMRKRCREYVEAKTLEAWVQDIGKVCAAQWGMQLDGTGKLRRPS